jgi:hypothetical protein
LFGLRQHPVFRPICSGEKVDITRREFLISLIAFGLAMASTQVLAKEGEGGGGHSGPGGGDDDDDDDDDNNDDGGGKNAEQERARKAVRKGKAVPLQKLLSFIRENHNGRILKVNLMRAKGGYFYRVRMLGKGNRVQTLVLDAVSLKKAVY